MKQALLQRSSHRSSTARWAIRYLAALAGTIVALAACTATVTILIDPYNLFGTPRIAGFNRFKPQAYNRGVAAKTALLERTHPRTLLLGNSRLEIGFNPQSAEWPASMQPVFDGALGGHGLDIAAKLLEDAAAEPTLHYVLVGADIVDFLSLDSHGSPDEPVNAGPDQDRMRLLPNLSPNPNYLRARIEDWLGATLTLGAVTDSITTLQQQWNAFPATMTPRGFNPLLPYESYVMQHGFRDLFDQKQTQYAAWFASCPHPSFADPYRSRGFRALREIVEVAHERKLDLTLIIYPYHAWLVDLMRRDGLWDSFEDWKRALVRVVAALDPDRQVRIVDFSGYNAYTTEAVPSPGDTRSDMKWYWEPGHFRSSLGDAMIRRLFDDQNSSFGRVINSSTIDQVNRSIRQEAALYSERTAMDVRHDRSGGSLDSAGDGAIFRVDANRHQEIACSHYGF